MLATKRNKVLAMSLCPPKSIRNAQPALRAAARRLRSDSPARAKCWRALAAALLAAGPDRPPLAPLETDRFSPLPPLAAREVRSRYALWMQGARFLARIGRQTSA